MRVCLASEHRFLRLPDGSVWTRNQQAAVWSWHRYLEVFDAAVLVARVQDVERLDGHCHRADGPGVSFSKIPYYKGPAQFVRQALRVHRAVRAAVHPGDAFILRVPGLIGDLVWDRLRTMPYPYGAEALGDPHDVFSRDAVRHPLRGFFRWRGTRRLRLECAQACAVTYVTERALQARYPATGPASSVSGIELPDDVFVEEPRKPTLGRGAPARLVFVGSLEQYYKGPDVLVHALAMLVRRGYHLDLTMVGDGRHRAAIEALARQQGCFDRIRFTGQLTSASVFAELDRADLFVLPSRTEGLPRALLEAMTRGLPCIGSRVGGIPELLPLEATVPRGDSRALADKIAELIVDPARLYRLSAQNLERAKAYRRDILRERRVAFLRLVREATEARLRDRAVASQAAVSLARGED